MTPGLSLHVMTRNPPMDRFAALIALMQPYVNETVIVNTGMPEDDRRTIETWSRQNGTDSEVVIVDATFTDFASTRNKGLEQHRYEWTMVLDTDEVPSAAMIAHAFNASTPNGHRMNPKAVGHLYYTYGWANGRGGQSVPHDWHCRVFRTEGSYFFRPVHELVAIGGVSEVEMRGGPRLPTAPLGAFLIHSYIPDTTGAKDRLYAELGSNL